MKKIRANEQWFDGMNVNLPAQGRLVKQDFKS